MAGPSRHLRWSELACRDGTPYPAAWRETRAIRLADVFEQIRSECGGLPIVVNSAYRTPAYNRRVGGAPASQHVQGRALDLRPPRGMTAAAFYRRIREIAPAIPDLKGLGRYNTFVHIDIRPTAQLVAWDMTGDILRANV